MCLLTLRSTDNKDGTIQQDDPPTSCKDGRQDFNIQQFSSIEKHEREAATSYIKTPCSIRKKLEAAINLDRSFNADAVWDEDFGELRATLESADDNLKTQMLQNQTNNLKEENPKLEMEKDKMCLKTVKQTSNTESEIQHENQLAACDDCSTDIHVRQFSVNYQNEECTDKHNALKCPALIFKLVYDDTLWELIKATALPLLSALNIQERWRTIERINLAAEKITIERIILAEMKHEEKQHIRQLFLMLLLIILIKNICESIKCKQSSCRKYPCLNSILYLLWQSGDVEVNPGPAKSITYRNWLYEVCPIARKAIAGVSTDCKMNKIWQQKPKNWPPKESYFNPRVKGVNEVEDLLINLLHCCDDTSKLPHDISSEIDTWNAHRSKDNDKLLHLYRTRKCCMSIEQINRSLKVLQSYLSAYDSLIIKGNTCIRISLSFQPARDQQVITHKIYRSVATRKMSSFLCRILHGKDPEVKCDDIWTLTPDGWPSCLRYYNPNNGGERYAEDEDGMVVEALITLCEKKSIILPKSYEDMVDAWQADDQKLLSKLLTRHTAETDLKKAVMKLHKEGLLKDVDENLRELGLLIQCERKAQKRKMVNTINKHDTKRTKQRDNEGAVDTTPIELFPDCFLGEFLRNNTQDDPLPDMIRKYLPDSLNDAFDDIQC